MSNEKKEILGLPVCNFIFSLIPGIGGIGIHLLYNNGKAMYLGLLSSGFFFILHYIFKYLFQPKKPIFPT